MAPKKFSLLLLILALKVTCTWLALNIFVRLTTVSDPFTYVQNQVSLSEALSNRTEFVGLIANTIAQMSNDTLPHYVFSIVSGVAIWFLLRELPSRISLVVMPILFLPSAAMWTSLVSKESLASTGLCLILAAWVRVIRSTGADLTTLLYAVTGFYIYGFLRPHFAIGTIIFFAGSLLLRPKSPADSQFTWILPPIYRFNTPLLLACLAFTLISSSEVFAYGLGQIINQALDYFRHAGGGSSRNDWLNWNSVTSFYENAWWAIPFSVIGPLPSEVIEKPIFLPALIEGALIIITPVLSSFIFGLKVSVKSSPRLLYYYRIFFIILPLTTMYLYLVHAPHGTMNPGSAIRYRAGFEYIITFPWIFMAMTIQYAHHKRLINSDLSARYD